MHELDELARLVSEGDEDESQKLVKQLITQVEPIRIINVLTQTMRVLGEEFERKEIFIPELLIASEALQKVMEIVEPYLGAECEVKKKTVVIGTVAGDLHEIGKNIVGIILKSTGYNVIDLGVDVSAGRFFETAEAVAAEAVALSSLMTSTMFGQRDFIELLKERGQRDKYIVLVGGAPINQRWADQIGADAYCEDAFKAVAYLDSILQ